MCTTICRTVERTDEFQEWFHRICIASGAGAYSTEDTLKTKEREQVRRDTTTERTNRAKGGNKAMVEAVNMRGNHIPWFTKKSDECTWLSSDKHTGISEALVWANLLAIRLVLLSGLVSIYPGCELAERSALLALEQQRYGGPSLFTLVWTTCEKIMSAD